MAQAQLAKANGGVAQASNAEAAAAVDEEEEAVAEPVTVARLGALLQKMSQGAMPAEVGGSLAVGGLGCLVFNHGPFA
jgi:hypothetical protein